MIAPASDRATLLSMLAQPRQVRVSQQTWLAAAVLAGLRVAVNDPIRRGDRDRGEDKNWLADLWGAFGELVALRALNTLTDQPIKHCPIDFEKHVDDVDLVVEASDGPLRLEAKAHLLERGKSYFMVNERARDNSAKRGAVGYMPVISAPGAGRALVGRLVTLAEMESWRPPAVRLHDPAVAVTIDAIAKSHFGGRLSQIHESLGDGLPSLPRDELMQAVESAGVEIDRWRQQLPPLDSRSAQEVVATIKELRARR